MDTSCSSRASTPTLDLFFLRPRALTPLVSTLAEKLSGYRADAVCGPLVDGAFLAQLVAAELDIECYHAGPGVSDTACPRLPVPESVVSVSRLLTTR